MRKVLFALFFLSSFSLFALTSFSPISENPCTIPNLSTRCDPCEREIDLFAQLIVWTAKEAGADCWSEVLLSSPTSSSNEIRGVHFPWEAGFRVGFGYGMTKDAWDTRVFYTWFHTQGKDSVDSIPGSVHSAFLGNFYINNSVGAGLSGPAYQQASIDWIIHFDMFDWEIGRSFWVSRSLSLRPFAVIRGGWIHQTIQSSWQNPAVASSEYFSIGHENLKNNFWGIGPGAGLQTQWNLFEKGGLFYLFGDFTAALMWGHWSFSDVFQNNLPQKVSIHLEPINGGASTLRTFMGFGWTSNPSFRSYQISAKLGYEMQFWLDQLQFYSFTGGRLVNELTLQGGTFELSLDF